MLGERFFNRSGLLATTLAVVFSVACGSADSSEGDVDGITDDGPVAPLCSCDETEICGDRGCEPATCTDLNLGGNETDVDCGGDCGPCSEGQSCSVAADCASRFCDAGICRDCTDDSNCEAVQDGYCDLGICSGGIQLANACEADGECASGFCVDGVCCDTACAGACEACLGELTGGDDGICDFIAADTDPEAECEADSAASCGQTGVCDGAGACALYDSSTECGAASCSAGEETAASYCDGTGSCLAAETSSCGLYPCDGDACATSCSGDEDCGDGGVCTGGICVACNRQGVNIAGDATAAYNRGSIDQTTYGPHKMNDGRFENTCEFSWFYDRSPDVGWIELTWPTTRTLWSFSIDTVNTAGTVCTAGANRTLAGGTVQIWNGSAWVDVTVITGQTNDWSYTFASPVRTSKLRLYAAYSATQANPVVYEWQAFTCRP